MVLVWPQDGAETWQWLHSWIYQRTIIDNFEFLVKTDSYENDLSCFFFLMNCSGFYLIAEMPLDALKKHYAGAYADNFEWPQPSPHSDDDEMEETEGTFVIVKLNCENK